MTLLDQMTLTGQVLTAGHDTAGHLADAGLFYGPGVILLTAALTAWKTCRWIAGRLYDQHQRRRARRDWIRDIRHRYYLTPSHRERRQP